MLIDAVHSQRGKPREKVYREALACLDHSRSSDRLLRSSVGFLGTSQRISLASEISQQQYIL